MGDEDDLLGVVAWGRCRTRAVLRDVFAAFPNTSRPLLDYHQALLCGPRRSASPSGS
jgi:hypothetical protein